VEESVSICIMCGKDFVWNMQKDRPSHLGRRISGAVKMLKKVSRDLFAMIAGTSFYQDPVNKKTCSK